MELFEFALHAGMFPDAQFFARMKRTSSGSPIAICAERREEPETTMRPMMLQISRTSIERSFLPSRFCITLQMSAIPSMSAPGPDAVPPNVFNGAPYSRIRIVEYEKDLPVSKYDFNTAWRRRFQPWRESGTIMSASLLRSCVIDTPDLIFGKSWIFERSTEKPTPPPSIRYSNSNSKSSIFSILVK